MSKINDALKRAKEAQRENTPSGMTPMRPLEPKGAGPDYRWILPALVILLIVVAVFFIALSVTSHTVKKIIAAPENSTTQPDESVEAPVPPVPPVIGAAAIINDLPKPTRVQGIFYDPVHPWAIISGRTVYVGDSVDGMRVAAISRGAITLVGNGQTNTLLVGQ
jgi:hypothetical protein